MHSPYRVWSAYGSAILQAIVFVTTKHNQYAKNLSRTSSGHSGDKRTAVPLPLSSSLWCHKFLRSRLPFFYLFLLQGCVPDRTRGWLGRVRIGLPADPPTGLKRPLFFRLICANSGDSSLYTVNVQPLDRDFVEL